MLPLSFWLGRILQAFRRPGLLPPALISCNTAGVLLPGGVQQASRRQGLLTSALVSSTAVLALFFFLQSEGKWRAPRRLGLWQSTPEFSMGVVALLFILVRWAGVARVAAVGAAAARPIIVHLRGCYCLFLGAFGGCC